MTDTVLLCIKHAQSDVGCAMFNEGTVHYSRTTTIGKELVDLKEARADGAISEEEYIKLKEEIMKGGPVSIHIETKN